MDVDYVPGSQIAIEPLIRFSIKNETHTTFFITGRFAEEYPCETRLIHDSGFDLGLHGWDHGYAGSGENFRTDSYEEQKLRISKTIKAIEASTGSRPLMNRNPDLWVSETTVKILKEERILIDSSVPAKRLVGRIRNLKYLFSPSTPYFPSEKNLSKSKDIGSVLEVPPSAFVLPINLSALRFFGLKVMKVITRFYSRFFDTIVFYGHPAEYLSPDQFDCTQESVKRHVENIGPHVYDLTEQFLSFTKELGYESRRLGELIDEYSLGDI